MRGANKKTNCYVLAQLKKLKCLKLSMKLKSRKELCRIPITGNRALKEKNQLSQSSYRHTHFPSKLETRFSKNLKHREHAEALRFQNHFSNKDNKLNLFPFLRSKNEKKGKNGVWYKTLNKKRRKRSIDFKTQTNEWFLSYQSYKRKRKR